MLKSRTDAAWFETSRRDLGALLSDHLHCERKAAENALSLVRRYSGSATLVGRLTRLAHEETSHLVQVAALLDERGLPLRPDTPNHYARGLLALVRGNEPGRRMDALLCAALIEARSHERLSLLAEGFAAGGEAELGEIYAALANAEDRHAELYVELAREGAREDVDARLAELAAREAEILAAAPPGSRVHSS
jgi:tRNA 2-(methylsulfanyl)-N6-isopentenyladenosine37 hydroxylase